MVDAVKPQRWWFRFRPRTLLVLVLTCGISCAWLSVKMQRASSEPRVLATVVLDGDRFHGASANAEKFFVLVDDTLLAFSSSGIRLWERDAPWYRHPDNRSGEEVSIPNFNRPAPVVIENTVIVLDCKNWKLSLSAYDFEGNLLATAKPLPYNMELQAGNLHLDKAGNCLAFGYCLATKSTFDNPDKGLLVFDEKLKMLRQYDVWGDHLCCSDDGSMYVRTVRWGKDTKWARISPDGQTTLLPTTVSRCTWVIQPGIGGEMILWGSKNINGEPSDSDGVRRVWKPSMPDATTIIEYKKDWLGEMVACPNSRYVLRVWPDHKQKFLCLSSEGQTIWEHDLVLSCYFWPPDPHCGPNGNVYLMDTVPGFHLWANDVVVRCLTPSGDTAWELAVDQTNEQPVFASCMSPSSSHLLLVRRSSRVNDSLSHKVKLVFVATGGGVTE